MKSATTAATQLAALCCLFMAYLTGAEKLSQHHTGYNYNPPTTASTPVYYTPQQQTYFPPQPEPIRFHPKQAYSQPKPTYNQPKPTYSQPKPTYSQPKPSYSQTKPVTEMPMPFGYGFGVNDQYNGIDFGHHTNSDGKVTTGEYRVLLPDGRTQIVTYRVGEDTGYEADVTYEGEARPYEAPEVSYDQQPSHVAPTYGQPKLSYEEPQSSYDQPKPTYEQPRDTFELPKSSYSLPKVVKTPDTLYRSNF